jgi:hypothetical protein
MDKNQDYYERRSEAQKQIGTYLIILKDGSQFEQWGYNAKDAKQRLGKGQVKETIQLKKLSI